jgi:hypothetical protein
MCCVAAAEGHCRRCGLSGIHRVPIVCDNIVDEKYIMLLCYVRIHTYYIVTRRRDARRREVNRLFTAQSLQAMLYEGSVAPRWFFFTKLLGKKKIICDPDIPQRNGLNDVADTEDRSESVLGNCLG